MVLRKHRDNSIREIEEFQFLFIYLVIFNEKLLG